MRKLIGFWLVCYPLLVSGQFTYTIDQSIPLNLSSGTSPLAWAGGLNAAQYNTMDIDGDGQYDLVLFDRMANKVLTYVFRDGGYSYAPEYEDLFPDLHNWLLLRDYDCDGKKDIFTGDILGMRVYRNVTAPGGVAEWELFTFFTAPGSPKSQVVMTLGFNLINLQIQFDDLPSISDLDGDGDLDILTMRFSGSGTIEYHKNFSQELYGTCDSLSFQRITMNWGGVTECECGTFAFQGAECPPSSGGRVKHAGGKVLMALDVDGDDDQDLLISEAECTELFLLENEGTSGADLFLSAVPFPLNEPASFLLYPAPFYEDVDRDGIKDLIVAPNLFNKEFLPINFQRSNWLYKNSGTNETPDFSFVTDQFLQQQMIDVGDQAVPALFDEDGDGDLDLIVGQNNRAPEPYGSLTYFENTGTPSSPSFSFVTDNYINFVSFEQYNIKPFFHDANRDGKIDLIWSSTDAESGQTSLYMLVNKSASGADFSNQMPIAIPFAMLFSENVHMTDVNEDGFADILIGKSNGAVQYWRNNGSGETFSFTLENSAFKGLGPSVERQSLTLNTTDVNGDGKTDLVFGDQYGRLGIISDYRSADSDIDDALFDLIYNPLLEQHTSRNLGGRIWISSGRIFGGVTPALVIGNLLGGLQMLRNEQSGPGAETDVALVYPNPVRASGTLNVLVDRPVSLQLLTVLGQEITPAVDIPGQSVFSFQVPEVSSGLYILRIMSGGKNLSRRIVILK